MIKSENKFSMGWLQRQIISSSMDDYHPCLHFLSSLFVFNFISFSPLLSLCPEACAAVGHSVHMPPLFQKRGGICPPCEYAPPEIWNSMFLPLLKKAVRHVKKLRCLMFINWFCNTKSDLFLFLYTTGCSLRYEIK